MVKTLCNLTESDLANLTEIELILLPECQPIAVRPFKGFNLYKRTKRIALVRKDKNVKYLSTPYRVNSDSPQTLRYQVEGSSGLLKANEVQSITVVVVDTSTGAATVFSPTVNTTVFNARAWSDDSLGYNVEVTVPANALTADNTVYQIQLLIAPTSGDGYYLEHVLLQTVRTYN